MGGSLRDGPPRLNQCKQIDEVTIPVPAEVMTNDGDTVPFPFRSWIRILDRIHSIAGKNPGAGVFGSVFTVVIESPAAAPANGKGGNVDIPQEAFIEVLKA